MLKEYRLKQKLSQEKLEELTSIDWKTIFRIENNINMPLLDTFAKIVIALNLTDEERTEIVGQYLSKQGSYKSIRKKSSIDKCPLPINNIK